MFEANTLVSTDTGFVRISDLNNNNVVTHNEKEDDFYLATKDTQNNYFYYLTLEDGRQLQTSPDQQFLLYKEVDDSLEWTPLSKLEIDDKIVISGYHNFENSKFTIQECMLAYILGLYQTKSTHNIYSEVWKTKTEITKLKVLFNSWYLLFNESLEEHYDKEGVALYTPINSNGLIEIKKILGDNLKVPDIILSNSSKVQSCYLQGVTDYALKQEIMNYIAIFSNKQIWLHDVQCLFNDFSVKANINLSGLLLPKDHAEKILQKRKHIPSLLLELYSNLSSDTSLYKFLLTMDRHNYSLSQIVDIKKKGEYKEQGYIVTSPNYDVNGVITKN